MHGHEPSEATLSNTVKHSFALFQQLKLPLLVTALGWIGLTKSVEYIFGLISVGYAAPVLGVMEMVVEPVLLFGCASTPCTASTASTRWVWERMSVRLSFRVSPRVGSGSSPCTSSCS